MTRRNLAYWIAAACAMVAPGVVYGQAEDAFCEGCYHEQQWFAPVDFDYDCRPIDRGCGYFFNYSKLSWFVDAERTAIGSPGATVLSEDIFPAILALSPLDQPPQQYVVANGLQNVTPGQFGGGDRYEVGYFSGQHGWMAGIISDQRTTSTKIFGNGPESSGFGSIHVNFELQNPDLLLGFRDYGGVFTVTDFADGDVPTPTINGPGIVPPQDGVVDDLNGNLAEGPVGIFVDIDGDGDLDLIGIAVDFGDLYNFNVTFNQVAVRNSTRTDGIELMKTYIMNNDHWFTKEQAGQVEIGAGVRFMRFRDEFQFAGTSDLLRGANRFFPGNFINTRVDNDLVGPQIYARYTYEQHRWQFGAAGRCMFAYNIENLSQRGAFGLNLLPGGLNQPLILQPTTFNYGRQDNAFSPVVEFRADATYKFTKALSAKLGYTAIFTDNITRAASVTRFRLPDGGFLASSQQHLFMNGADFGFELVY